MKKILSLPLWSPVFLWAAQSAYAQELCPSGYTSLCKIRLENGGLVGAVVSTIIVIAVVACLAFMVLGAIKWISSGGDEAKVKAARSTIVAALVGMVISLLGFFIVNLVLGFFGIGGLKALSMPKLIP